MNAESVSALYPLVNVGKIALIEFVLTAGGLPRYCVIANTPGDIELPEIIGAEWEIIDPAKIGSEKLLDIATHGHRVAGTSAYLTSLILRVEQMETAANEFIEGLDGYLEPGLSTNVEATELVLE